MSGRIAMIRMLKLFLPFQLKERKEITPDFKMIELTLEEAQLSVSFSIKLPDLLPTGYELHNEWFTTELV